MNATDPSQTPTPTPACCQATDPSELRRQIMSSLVAKNEREHWAARAIEKLERELAESRAANELKDMQLAGCMTATVQNTETTIKDRITRDNPYWCQAYDDVCKAIDREMALRAALLAAQAQVETLREALEKILVENGKVQAWSGATAAMITLEREKELAKEALAQTPESAASEVRALREDKAILDWMQARYASVVFNPHMNFYQVRDDVNNTNLAADEGIRAAIDAARKQTAMSISTE